MTDRPPPALAFEPLGSREVVASFDGGLITADAGALLRRELDSRSGFIDSFTRCFTDHRDPERIEHPPADLLRPRIFGLGLGYEDLNEHDPVRFDPLFAVAVGKTDPLGLDRACPSDRGKPLAGKSTRNRLELTPVGANEESRCQKTVARLEQIENCLADMFVVQNRTPPKRRVLDLASTDDPLHGHQRGRFFHGEYGKYCPLPLSVFAGDHPLAAILRPSDIDGAAGRVRHRERIVRRRRAAWPGAPVVLRADSGFCRE